MKNILLIFFPALLFSQIPDYYEGINFKQNGSKVKEELHDLINATHHSINYTPGVWNILNKSDLAPESKNKVLMIYGFSDSSKKFSEQRTRDVNNKNQGKQNESPNGKWEREHVFPKSLAVPKLDTSHPGTGTDAHNIRAVDRQINATRNNNPYREKSAIDKDGKAKLNNGAFYPGDEWTGDVARIVMYMYLHYGLETDPQKVAYNKATTNKDKMPTMFLKWNAQDKVSEFEKVRNEVIAAKQGSRNPFIDNPYLATIIWGGEKAENTWKELEKGNSNNNIKVSYDSKTNKINIVAQNFKKVNLYTINGQLLKHYITKTIDLKNYSNKAFILAIELKDGTIVTRKISKK